MDFVSDSLLDGRRLRALTVVDHFPRESLAIAVDQGIQGEQVVEVLDPMVAERGAPKWIRVDHGAEFVRKALDRWAYEPGVTLDCSRPGKPTDNAEVESCHGRLREEGLHANWLLSWEDAPAQMEAWGQEYNVSRPHTALGHVPPAEFAAGDGASPGLCRSTEPGNFTL